MSEPQVETQSPEKPAEKSPEKSGEKSGEKKPAKSGKKGDKKGSKKGSKKSKKPKGPTLRERLKGFLTWFKTQVSELVESIQSPDAPTRQMTYLFFASLFGLFVVIGIGFFKYREFQHWKATESPEALAKQKEERLAKKNEEDRKKRQRFMLPVGEISVELRATAQSPRIEGTLNIATIGFVFECDTEETCLFFEDKKDQVRHQITVFLTTVDRLEMLSREGKRKIKKAVLERVNAWVGSIEAESKFNAVYISSLIIN